MNWFDGSIQDAITTSKKKKAVFVVYIEGADELSVNMTKVLNNATVSNKFKSNNFVAVKLAKGSEGHKQFEEFYKLVPVPSVFFIDQNGCPMQVVVSETSEEVLLKKLGSAIDICLPAINTTDVSQPSTSVSSKPSTSKSSNDVGSSSPTTSEAPVLQQNMAANIANDTSKKETLKDSSTEVVQATSSSVDVTSVAESPGSENNSAVDKEKSLEERVEKAKVLLEKKREEKVKEERKKEKDSEMERRRIGQEVQQAKRNQHDRELRELKEERDREKKEETLARKRILEQIAQDRADRAQRLAMTGSTSGEVSHKTPEVAPPPPSVNSNIARLQFKLLNGETKSHSFPAETTLLEVREFIDNNIVLPFSEYQLATTFPRVEFTARDNRRDLRSLQLVPSAVILILPVNGSVTMRSTFGWTQVIIDMMWDMVNSVISVTRNLTNIIFRRGNHGTTTNTSSNNQSAASSDTKTQSYSAPPAQRLGGTSTVRKRGNIYSLDENRDDNDENNTWNGNSTQQM